MSRLNSTRAASACANKVPAQSIKPKVKLRNIVVRSTISPITSLTPARGGDAPVHLPYTLGPRRGAGLQKVRRFDPVDRIGAPRRDGVPAGPQADEFLVHL